MNDTSWVHGATLLVISFVAADVSAHHSPSAYDTDKVVTVTGVVSKIDWFNPHVYLYVEETTDRGSKVIWEIEGFPPALFRRVGWHRDTVRIGDTLQITGSPAKDAKDKSIFPSVIVRGDKTLFALREALTPKTQAASVKSRGIEGVWSTALTREVVTKAAGPAPSLLTKAGTDARSRFDEKSSPTSNCIPVPSPWWMITPELKRITLSNGMIDIEGELGVRRIVHMNVAAHDGVLPSIQGHSIGRWDGKTLVIDTARFAYHGTGNGGGNGIGPGVPSSTQKRLIERLTPNANGASLTYSYEITDPEFLAQPRTGSVEWMFSPEAKFETERCDLENAHRFMKP